MGGGDAIASSGEVRVDGPSREEKTLGFFAGGERERDEEDNADDEDERENVNEDENEDDEADEDEGENK